MHNDYKPTTSAAQVFVALVATVLIGSVAMVGTVGQAQAATTPARTQIVA